MRNLSQWLAPWEDHAYQHLAQLPKDLYARDLSLDSRTIQQGDVFLAVPGQNFDGRNFIQQATHQQAILIISEQPCWSLELHAASSPIKQPTWHLSWPKLSQVIPQLAASFYQNPDKQLPIIAITGTNGKTSIAWLLAGLGHYLGSGAYSGTLGFGLWPKLEPWGNTTPDCPRMQSWLAKLCHVSPAPVTVGCEVSSHALAQKRWANISAKFGIWTQLSRDHLDYHHSMAEYLKSKLLLVPQCEFWLINWQCCYRDQVVACIEQHHKTWLPYGWLTDTDPPRPGYWVQIERQNWQGTHFKLFDPDNQCIEAFISWLGEFQVLNAAACLAVLHQMGQPWAQIVSALRQVPPPPGRMQTFLSVTKKQIIVDYAHTPAAVKSALHSLRSLQANGRIGVVFGCGGQRDRGKRAMIGAEVASQADWAILTSDNPRGESIETINHEILTGIPAGWPAQICNVREQAIAIAIKQLGPTDILLITGSGPDLWYDQFGQATDDIQQVNKNLSI